MKRLSILIPLLALAVALGAVAACARNDTPKNQVDKALQGANLNDVHTTYDKDSNVVHLQGTVDSPETKRRAEQVASGAVGTSGKVMDELKVQGMDDRTLDDRDKLIQDTLKDQVEKDPVLRDRSIDFDVNNGAVTVKGNVRTADEKQRVGDLAKGISGVNEVANELEIKPKK